MDPVNQSSDNSIGGHPAADDIPNDGTGMSRDGLVKIVA